MYLRNGQILQIQMVCIWEVSCNNFTGFQNYKQFTALHTTCHFNKIKPFMHNQLHAFSRNSQQLFVLKLMPHQRTQTFSGAFNTESNALRANTGIPHTDTLFLNSNSNRQQADTLTFASTCHMHSHSAFTEIHWFIE